MPSLADNQRMWSESCPWAQRGDEWSSAWGGTRWLWHTTIFPRIANFLPTGRLLELAPGFGRCTQFLGAQCRSYIGVDMTLKCVEACRRRFHRAEHMEFVANDGASLEAVENDSIDFVFSWDSMVHVEADVLEAYLQELARTLRSGAFGFIHHSNFAALHSGSPAASRPNPHWRATSVSASLFASLVKKAGLTCLVQELVPWGGEADQDCFSLICKDEDRFGIPPIVARNPTFWEEAHAQRAVARLYAKRPEILWFDQAMAASNDGDHATALSHIERALASGDVRPRVLALRSACRRALSLDPSRR